MKKRTLKTLGIMVLSITMLASTVTGCGGKETSEVQGTEIVEAVVETEAVVPETEVVEEATEEIVVEDTETTEVEETEMAEEEVSFNVTDMSATKYAKQSVNVRKGPSTDYEQIGSLSTNQKVTVTGQADTGWYRIEYNGAEGYVSDKYLSDQKVTASTSTNTNNASSTGSTASTQNQSTDTTTDTTQNQTPAVDNSGSTGDASTSAPSTSTPSADTGTSTTTPDASTSAPSADTSGSADVTLDNWWETDDAPMFDPSTNPEVEGMGGGIFFNQ